MPKSGKEVMVKLDLKGLVEPKDSGRRMEGLWRKERAERTQEIALSFFSASPTHPATPRYKAVP